MTKKGFIHRYKHIILKILAVFFLLLGLLGFVLPVIPGIVFFVLGLILLGEESPLRQKIIAMLPEKMRKAIEKKEQENKASNSD